MKVQIIKAEMNDWYSTWIGKVVDVYKENDKYYFIGDPLQRKFINVTDCLIINDGEFEYEERSSVVDSILERLDKIEKTINDIKSQKEEVKEEKPIEQKKPRIPDENTPVDTLVRVRDNSDFNWSIRHFKRIEDRFFYCFDSGRSSKTQEHTDNEIGWLLCEIVEETIEEKRARIFHKFVPKEHRWYAVDESGKAYFYRSKPYVGGGICWVATGDCGHAGFADPYDWKNSLIGRDE